MGEIRNEDLCWCCCGSYNVKIKQVGIQTYAKCFDCGLVIHWFNGLKEDVDMISDINDNILKDICDYVLERIDILEDFEEYVPYFVGESDIRRAKEKVTKHKWRKITGVVTPGGDPSYTCPNCGGGTHINGIESRKDWKYCPDCGARLEY